MKDHRSSRKVRVEGHTDNVGGKTSTDAERQRRPRDGALVKLGVEKSGSDVGRGQDVPIDLHTEEGRANNRRRRVPHRSGPEALIRGDFAVKS